MVQYDRTIPPGWKGKITLKIQTKNLRGRIHKTARVFSNDLKNPKLTIAIAGNIWVPILVGTNRVFLRGMVHEDITNTVIVKGQKQEPLELEIISMSLPEKVAVELHRKKEEGSYVVGFKNLLKDEGFYAGEVRLLTNYVDEPEIRIQILGAIQSLVVARPKVLTFVSMPEKYLTQMSQSGSFVATRQVMVYLAKGDNLKIEKVELGKPLFTVIQKELQPGSRYKILITPIPEKLSKGQNEDLMRIHTNQKDYEVIEIPVHLNITE